MTSALSRRSVRFAVYVGLCIAVIASLVQAKVQADSAAIDWPSVIKQHSAKNDLSIRERFELAIAYANTGDIWGTQREFEALDRAGWTREAQAMLSESRARLEEDPDSLMDLNVMAFAAYVMQDYELSSSTFQRILEVDEGNDWPRLYLAWTYGSLGKIDEGIAELEYLVKKHPWNFFLRALLLFAKTQR